VLEKALAGSLSLLVKFSTLQEYGVDKPFFLENDNVDSSQRNVVFLVRGEKAKTVISVASELMIQFPYLLEMWSSIYLGQKGGFADSTPLCVANFAPYIKTFSSIFIGSSSTLCEDRSIVRC